MPQMSTVNENNDNSSILQIQISNTDEVRCNISTNLSTYYKNFIKNAQDNFMAKIRLDNQISQNDHSTNNSAFNGIHNVSNYDERVQQLAADIQKLTVGQKRAYDKAISHLWCQPDAAFHVHFA
jgi:hypothetical protein